jgi:hypothetical protein
MVPTQIHTRPTEQRTQNKPTLLTATWPLKKLSKTYIGEKTTSSTNDAGKTCITHVDYWNEILISDPVQKSFQNGLKTLILDQNP